jgi:hypothetical protein
MEIWVEHAIRASYDKTLSMKESILMVILSGTIAVCMAGCRQPSDTDVSSSSRYNFSSFSNTVWKTKVKVALADLKQYTGRHALTLVAPQAFDSTHPEYNPPRNIRVTAVLPVGTPLRIGRLVKDNGNWGGVRVTVILEDGKEVNIDRMLLAKNQFLYDKETSPSTNWGVAPDTLEAAGYGAPHP